MSHCLKEPRKITRRESDVSYLMYFGILSCYDIPMPKLYLLLFLFCYVSKSCNQTKTIIDVCLLCEMKLLVVFCICVREFGSFTAA